MQDMVKAIRKYAMDHYEQDGWDYVVECWDDNDIIRHSRGYSFQEAIAKIGKIVSSFDDRRKDIEATAW